jgi:hypothetical protein
MYIAGTLIHLYILGKKKKKKKNQSLCIVLSKYYDDLFAIL